MWISCLSFFLLSSISLVLGEEIDLSIILITSSFAGYNTTFVTDAVNTAISTVNNSTILDGYYINDTTIIDSECNKDEILDELLTYAGTVRPLAIIGCGCLNSTEILSELINHTNFKNVPVVSYSSQSAKLSNTSLYPSLFRTVPAFQGIQNVLHEFISYYNWKQVFIFSQDISINIEELHAILYSGGIGLYNLNHTHAELFNSTQNERIFIVDAYGSETRKILCEAYKSSVYYPGYAWIIIDNFIDNNWYTISDTNCTIDEIKRVLEFSISIGTSPGNSRNEIALYAYDAVMAVVMAFYRTMQEEAMIEDSSIIDELRMLTFNGLSGEISWTNGDGDRSNTVIIMTQLHDDNESDIFNEKIIGYYQHKQLTLNLSSNIWPLGVPSDGLSVIVIDSVQLWAFTFVIVMCMGGISWALVCFTFVWIHRKKKVIKLTSPNLNYVILISSTSVFLSSIAYSFPSNDINVLKYICPFQPFLATVFGYNLCVTVATIKLWRIYYIFKDPKISKKIPKDWQLLIVIGVHTFIYFIIAGTVVLADAALFPPELVKEDKDDSFNPETGELQTYYFLDCRTNSIYARVYYAITIGHIFIVHFLALFFAFRMRKIKVMVLNEYKYTLAFILISIAIVIIMIVILSLVGSDQTLFALFVSFLISSVCLLFLGLTFIPKMVALKKDPTGDHLFDGTKDIEDGIPQNNADGANKGEEITPGA